MYCKKESIICIAFIHVHLAHVYGVLCIFIGMSKLIYTRKYKVCTCMCNVAFDIKL